MFSNLKLTLREGVEWGSRLVIITGIGLVYNQQDTIIKNQAVVNGAIDLYGYQIRGINAEVSMVKLDLKDNTRTDEIERTAIWKYLAQNIQGK